MCLEILLADLQIQRCCDYIWRAHETLFVSGTSKGSVCTELFFWVIILLAKAFYHIEVYCSLYVLKKSVLK